MEKVQNEELVKQVENSPFVTINTDKGYVIAVGGKMAIPDRYFTREEAEERINQTDWSLIYSMLQALKTIDFYTLKEDKL